MTPSLADALPVLLARLPQSLAAPGASALLNALAGRLPPILRGGFECRLHRDDPRLDLQLCVDRDEPGRPRLDGQMRCVEVDGRAGLGWGRLHRFLEHWAGTEPGSALAEQVPEIWLEFDLDGPASRLAPPALFVGLPQQATPAGASLPLAAEALDLLLGAQWAPWRGPIERCFASCPGGVFISHVGAMLSRDTPALRVNVKRLDGATLPEYLERSGWPGDPEAVAGLMAPLWPLTDRLTLALDVGERVYPTLGLELILQGQPPAETRWAALLDHLVAEGWCSPDKGSALLDWPGASTPADTGVDWPGHLIAESLLQPVDRFGLFDRRISHIKLGLRPGATPEAKGYLWFEHRWAGVSPA